MHKLTINFVKHDFIRPRILSIEQQRMERDLHFYSQDNGVRCKVAVGESRTLNKMYNISELDNLNEPVRPSAALLLCLLSC